MNQQQGTNRVRAAAGSLFPKLLVLVAVLCSLVFPQSASAEQKQDPPPPEASSSQQRPENKPKLEPKAVKPEPEPEPEPATAKRQPNFDQTKIPATPPWLVLIA